MPRPNLDRVMVSFYIARDTKARIVELAHARGETQAETVRALLTYALRRMPKGWTAETRNDARAAPGSG